MKQIIFGLAVLTSIFIVVSYFAKVPYIYTLLGIATWVLIGHLITMDDDMEGGWSNLDRKRTIWDQSKRTLLLKFLFVILLLIILFAFPSIKNI